MNTLPAVCLLFCLINVSISRTITAAKTTNAPLTPPLIAPTGMLTVLDSSPLDT